MSARNRDVRRGTERDTRPDGAGVSRGAQWRTTRRLAVFYDGMCVVCRGSMATLKRFDWLDLIVPTSFHEPGVIARERLDPMRLARRMQARRAAGGPVVEGIDAVILIAWRVPLLWAAAPLLVVARWIGVGQPAYDFVAARRHRILLKR